MTTKQNQSKIVIPDFLRVATVKLGLLLYGPQQKHHTVILFVITFTVIIMADEFFVTIYDNVKYLVMKNIILRYFYDRVQSNNS